MMTVLPSWMGVGEAVESFDAEVHAFSLMPTRYHFLVRSVHGDLSRTMHHIDGMYTLGWCAAIWSRGCESRTPVSGR